MLLKFVTLFSLKLISNSISLFRGVGNRNKLVNTFLPIFTLYLSISKSLLWKVMRLLLIFVFFSGIVTVRANIELFPCHDLARQEHDYFECGHVDETGLYRKGVCVNTSISGCCANGTVLDGQKYGNLCQKEDQHMRCCVDAKCFAKGHQGVCLETELCENEGGKPLGFDLWKGSDLYCCNLNAPHEEKLQIVLFILFSLLCLIAICIASYFYRWFHRWWNTPPPSSNPQHNYYDLFLAHNWGLDIDGRNNHARVMNLVHELQQRGFRVWVDSLYMNQNSADIRSSMANGISRSKVILICITQLYSRKVQKFDHSDNAYYEFQASINLGKANDRIPVVMENDMMDVTNWGERLRAELASMLRYNLSNDSFQVNELNQLVADIEVKIANQLQSVPSRIICLFTWLCIFVFPPFGAGGGGMRS